MPTNLAIDDALLKRAQKAGGFRTKKMTVTTALEELIQGRRQKELLRSLGTFDFRPDWNHRQGRRDRDSRR